jgi:hypothetical protein
MKIDPKSLCLLLVMPQEMKDRLNAERQEKKLLLLLMAVFSYVPVYWAARGLQYILG